MGLKVNNETHKDYYAKITRIWGSKSEGWFAWVGVFKTKYDQEPATSLLVTAPYSEDTQNLYATMYAAAKQRYDFLTDESLSSNVPVDVVEVKVEEELDVKPAAKKSRGKKNSA